jgi:hypothetical protein
MEVEMNERMTDEEYFSQMTEEEYFALPEPQRRRAIEVTLHELERKGFIEKQRDALGNVVTRPGEYGTPQVVWQATGLKDPFKI